MTIKIRQITTKFFEGGEVKERVIDDYKTLMTLERWSKTDIRKTILKWITEHSTLLSNSEVEIFIPKIDFITPEGLKEINVAYNSIGKGLNGKKQYSIIKYEFYIINE
jgi:hypothetical protein